MSFQIEDWGDGEEGVVRIALQLASSVLFKT